MRQDKILLAHGSGGRLSYELIKELVLPQFGNPVLNNLDDSASLPVEGHRLAFSTDSYVVKPVFFPGGDIGRLAIFGTVNDLCMVGAVPSYISVGLMIEEGLQMATLRRVAESMRQASQEAGVKIVCGDIKVAERGGLDQLFINTSGIGYIPEDIDISARNAKVGDLILLNGTIGDHGIAVLADREGFRFRAEIKSDCSPLNGLVSDMLKASRNIHVMRDPTRGGLATTLNEISLQSGVELVIDEASIPIKDPVAGACEMLGLDIFSVANEGKLVAFVPEANASDVLDRMKGNPLGRDAAIIGQVKANSGGRVILKTLIGGKRILDMPSGELLPRIC